MKRPEAAGQADVENEALAHREEAKAFPTAMRFAGQEDNAAAAHDQELLQVQVVFLMGR